MDDRISIPTSEDDGAPPSPGPRNAGTLWWITGVIGLLAMVGAFVVASDPAPDVADPSELSAPDTEGLPEPVANVVEFPGFGRITAMVNIDQGLLAVVSGNWGSTIWRLEAPGGVWRIADFFPGLTLVDAAALDDGLLVAGFETFDARPIVMTGEPGALRALDHDISQRFVPTRTRVDATGGFVLTAVAGPAAALGGPILWLRNGEVTIVDPGTRGGIEDVVRHRDDMLAFGSDGGHPAMWRVSETGELEPLGLDLDLGPGRVAAAASTEVGRLVGLVVGPLGNTLDSTVVVELEAPHTVLAGPTVGVWNELVVLPIGLVALPEEGPVVHRTNDGGEWFLERVSRGPSGADLVVEDVLVLSSGHEVFAGASSRDQPSGVPALTSRASLAADFELPDRGWTFIESVDETGVVHVGEIHVGIDGGTVVVRTGFGTDWFQPVFADVASVGGRVEVFEVEFGHLLTASEPFDALWYSLDGRAWQLIENGLLRVAAGRGDEVLVVTERGVSRMTPEGVVQVDDSEELVSFLGGVFEWVDGVGYVTQRPDGSLRASPDGVAWSDLDVDADVASAFVVDGRLLTRRSGTWRVLDPISGGLRAVTVPAGASTESLTVIRRDVVLVRDRARFWLSGDLETWFDASLGIWNGTDGVLIDGWTTAEGVVGLIGDAKRTGLYRRGG